LEADGPRAWRGRSDTETLLAAIDHWGLKQALQRASGMFALALWDRRERALTLARDRIGEKPLYFGWSNGTFLFGSELKALRLFPGFDASIDQDALALHLWFNYIPSPRSIYRHVAKLEAGRLLTVTAEGRQIEERYWALQDALEAPRFAGSPEEAAARTDALLRAAVREQAIADVPVGAFLSGGIDSSTVVAMMAEQASQVRTYALGFDHPDHDELRHARAVARHLGTDHTEMTVSAADALAIIPALPAIWDEPFGDSSQIAAALIAKLAGDAVTVSLTGDGGDELFGGYPWYARAQSWERLPMKPLLAPMAGRLLPALIDSLPEALTPARPAMLRRCKALGHRMRGRTPGERYLISLSTAAGEESLVRGARIGPGALTDVRPPPDCDPLTFYSAIDAQTYLPDDLLVKMDRAGMAQGLETRMPLLNHHLVEFAFSLPEHYKRRNGQTKWPLRQALYRRVPPALVDRPKQGFSIPIDAWLRGPLKEWASDLLSPQSLARDGLLDPRPIERLWRNQCSGAVDAGRELWAILMFQAWRRDS
jgi:asparagine synthase (glutamine-hydrolysing)